MAKKKETTAASQGDAAVSKKNAKRAVDIFKANTTAEELHFTSDGVAFLKKCDAENHARTLEDTAVESIVKGA